MNAQEFLGLVGTHNPTRWYLPVVPSLCAGGQFLFGGCGLGAAILAMQRTTSRPIVWATAQYLAYAKPGEVMDVDVIVPAAGHHTTQARVVAHVGDREILTVNAALGSRPFEARGQWETMPTVPPVADCPERAERWPDTESILDRLEMRIAAGRQWEDLPGSPGDGFSALWVRMPGLEMDAIGLAVLGDYVPYGISQALGMWVRSNSLDNTLRVVRLVPTEWVLLDIRAQAVDHGFGHGLVHLWAEDGTLLATASQSAIVRSPSAEE